MARRHPHPADRALAARHRRARRGARPVRARRSTSCRRCSTWPGSMRRRWSTASRSSRSTARRSRATFADAAAPSPRSMQYFEMLGSRSIVDDGWKATTDHVSKGVVDEERLIDGSRDVRPTTSGRCSTSPTTSPRAATWPPTHPDVLRALQERWSVEAGRNQVFPLVDELIGRIAAVVPWPNPVPTRAVYRPEGGPVPDDSVAAPVRRLPAGGRGRRARRRRGRRPRRDG